MARSRTTWVLLAFLFVAWLLIGRRVHARIRGGPAIAWASLFVVATVAWGPLSEGIGTYAPISVEQRVQGGGGRLRIWALLFEALAASPWVGYGWSQVSRAGLHGSLTHFTGESMLRNSHSFPLDLLLWNGIPLGLLFLGALVWWWIVQLRRCDSPPRWVVLCVVGAVFVHSLFEFPFEYYYFMLPVALLMGTLEAWAPEPRLRTAPRAVIAAALLAMAALTAWVGVEYMRVEDGSRDNRMLAAGYARSASLPDVWLLDEPREYMRFWRTQARPGMSPEEIAWMRRVAERNPSPPALLRYATALGINGQPDAAARTLVQLCNMHKASSCAEGRESWGVAQERFAPLRAVPYPPAR